MRSGLDSSDVDVSLVWVGVGWGYIVGFRWGEPLARLSIYRRGFTEGLKIELRLSGLYQ